MLVSIGPFEYRECPVRFLDPEGEQVVDLVRSGFKVPESVERLHLPARFAESVRFLEALKGDA